MLRTWAVLVGILCAAPAAAHDFMLAPSAHRIEPGASVSLVLRVGSDQELDELPRSNRRIVRFEAHTASGAQPVGGKHGESPAGTIALAEPGIATIIYQSSHSYVELDPAKFEAYLKEEGLDDIIAERKRLGLEPIPGRESYARYAKALITVGDGKTGFDREVGLPAELIALGDPRVKGTVQFQLLFDGKPRAGATVDLLRPEKSRLVSVAHGKTDADGKVSLAIPSDGRWLVSTTLMRRAPAELGLEGEWESFWVSLAFETGAAKANRGGGCATSEPTAIAIALALLALRRRRPRGKSPHIGANT